RSVLCPEIEGKQNREKNAEPKRDQPGHSSKLFCMEILKREEICASVVRRGGPHSAVNPWTSGLDSCFICRCDGYGRDQFLDRAAQGQAGGPARQRRRSL